ncbi:putative A/G-specific adenine DNA glycosylase [Klebsormidium nitens]|uniref:Adenine DNA glycosylase n=1 Tax=Klebsormidium nitens TaxID=105231 RepID=A0A1Y1ICM5_KLENI|nr:putative A/G-specific adenine DNA glycosylase [Klebsormidium nitens]|eukprot:GAQ86466.1 putative A/G-specific adenine DNA glycosylase [Klebsormidium nitens]
MTKERSAREDSPDVGHGNIGEIEDIGGKQTCFRGEEIAPLRKGLLRWYDRNHRELPWRINPHSQLKKTDLSDATDTVQEVPSKKRQKQGGKRVAPQEGPAGVPDTVLKESVLELAKAEGVENRAYAVWVSEVMCQQTRVVVVMDYFRKWMEKWPTVGELAQATQEEVIQVWAGLGYYRRARFLLEGAKYIMSTLGGRFPSTVPELLKVPGIGAYTAGAIASIAFDVRAPVVDGNVVRVLSRLRAISGDPTEKGNVKVHWSLAEQLVDAIRPGCFNQALMELGAMVCTPTSPDCSGCPVSGHCQALKLAESGIGGPVTEFPGKKVKKAPREETVAVCVVELRKGEKPGRSVEASPEYLLIQRPKTGLLAGLWEFPTVSVASKASKSVRRSALDSLLARLLPGGYETSERHEVGEYVHVFSHVRQTMLIERLVITEMKSGQNGKGVKRQREGVGGELEDESEGSTPQTRWVPEEEMTSVGLTSGVKKVLDMARKSRALTTQKS